MSSEQPPNEFLAQIGERIAVARQKKGISQLRAAEKAGLARQYLNEVENGRTNVTVHTLARIAHAIGTTASALLRGLSVTDTDRPPSRR